MITTNTNQIREFLKENFSEKNELRIDIEKYLDSTSDRDVEIPDTCRDIWNCDNIIEWIDDFYQYGFCENCNSVYDCNYCPAYAWHENYGYHDKMYRKESEIEEFEEKYKKCHSVCDNCIHCLVFDSECDNILHYCNLDIDSSELESCEQKEIYDKNQMTIYDLQEVTE